MDFLKLSRMNFFQIVKSDLEMFEILHKCCCNTKFLREIAFYHLVRVFCFLSRYSINLGIIKNPCTRKNREDNAKGYFLYLNDN